MPNVEVTGAARLYRAASVWTAGLGIFCVWVLSLLRSLLRRAGEPGRNKAEFVFVLLEGVDGCQRYCRYQ